MLRYIEPFRRGLSVWQTDGQNYNIKISRIALITNETSRLKRHKRWSMKKSEKWSRRNRSIGGYEQCVLGKVCDDDDDDGDDDRQSGFVFDTEYSDDDLRATTKASLVVRNKPNRAVEVRLLTLSPPIPLRLYTLPYWSNPLFLIFDIRAL